MVAGITARPASPGVACGKGSARLASSFGIGASPQVVPLVAEREHQLTHPLPPLRLARDRRERLAREFGEVGRLGEVLKRGGHPGAVSGGRVRLHGPPQAYPTAWPAACAAA